MSIPGDRRKEFLQTQLPSTSLGWELSHKKQIDRWEVVPPVSVHPSPSCQGAGLLFFSG